jgi:aryl-alcohol dehydrogenase-like predicted oxidoreductase
VYSNGESERLLGKAIKHIGVPRERLVILTKLSILIVPDGVPNKAAMKEPDAYGLSNQYGLSRKHIFDSVKASLARLELDYIDVLQCHRFDKDTPIEETMQALHDVVKAGWVRYIGMSSCAAWQFHMMQSASPKLL